MVSTFESLAASPLSSGMLLTAAYGGNAPGDGTRRRQTLSTVVRAIFLVSTALPWNDR